jgi:phosphoribosyl-ATP pyrophosphohydrolase/phosphoribosyl-AMP cyclohydrolase
MLNIDSLHFEKLGGLLPCIVQDARTNKVLMLGFMDKAAVEKTQTEKRITFFSRSKQALWTKGETSGNFMDLLELKADCDSDTLLALVHPKGPACHTGADTCFNEINQHSGLSFLEAVILERKTNPASGSYTNSLLDAGINRIAQKVGEEAVELVIEAKDDNRDQFLGEAADLMYHFLVLLAAKDLRLDDVVSVLKKRHGKRPTPNS